MINSRQPGESTGGNETALRDSSRGGCSLVNTSFVFEVPRVFPCAQQHIINRDVPVIVGLDFSPIVNFGKFYLGIVGPQMLIAGISAINEEK